MGTVFKNKPLIKKIINSEIKATLNIHNTQLVSDSAIYFHQNGKYGASDDTLSYAKAHGKIFSSLYSFYKHI